MYNPNLTREQIKNYLHIYNEVTEWHDDESAVDVEASPEMVRNKKIEAELCRQVLKLCTFLIAERLWQNKRAVPLVTQRDVDDLIQHLITVTLKKSDFFKGHATPEKAVLEGIQAFAKPTLDALAHDLSGPDAYNDEWRKIEIMECVCNELNVMPQELLHISGIGEQIIRHLYSDKESYRALLEKTLEDARSGIAAFRISAYQNLLIECSGELSEDIEREIRAIVDAEAAKLETKIIALHTRRIEETMRRIWPE